MRMELAQAQATGDTWQGVVTLFVLLLVFGYVGWKRGFGRELVVFFAIMFGQLLRATDVGTKLVERLNQFWALFKLAASAGFSPPKMMEKAGELSKMKPLIPSDRQQAFLFLLFIGVIFLGYFVGRFISSRPSPVAMVMGMINGYLIGSLILPLLPRQLPARVPGQRVSAAQQRQAGEFMHQGIEQLSQILGIQPAYVVLMLVGGLILWAAWKLR